MSNNDELRFLDKVGYACKLKSGRTPLIKLGVTSLKKDEKDLPGNEGMVRAYRRRMSSSRADLLPSAADSRELIGLFKCNQEHESLLKRQLKKYQYNLPNRSRCGSYLTEYFVDCAEFRSELVYYLDFIYFHHPLTQLDTLIESLEDDDTQYVP